MLWEQNYICSLKLSIIPYIILRSDKLLHQFTITLLAVAKSKLKLKFIEVGTNIMLYTQASYLSEQAPRDRKVLVH